MDTHRDRGTTTKDHTSVKGAHLCMRFMRIDAEHNLLFMQHRNVTKRLNQCVYRFYFQFFLKKGSNVGTLRGHNDCLW